MKIEALVPRFSVCKVADYSQVDWTDGLLFLGRTDEEKSLVCETARVPSNAVVREDGWRGFRVVGVLDFSLVGILSRISTVLADAGIGLFAVSTFNTDYVFVKAADFDRAFRLVEAVLVMVRGEEIG